MKLTFNLKDIDNFDKQEYTNAVTNYFNSKKVSHTWRSYYFNKHYGYRRMFAYMVKQFDNKNIVELGTDIGGGTLALAYNENNNVYTYDNVVKHSRSLFDISTIENVTPYILSSEGTKTAMGNVLEKPDHANRVLTSDVIFFDVDPHSGEHEDEMFYYLNENNYKGIVLWDDTNGQLKKWFSDKCKEISENYPNIRVYDLLKYSWVEGTALMCFGDQEIILK